MTVTVSSIVASANARLASSTGLFIPSASTASTTSTAQAKALAAASPFGKVNARIQQQVDSTKAQLSSLGLVKSAVAGLQTQSKQLTTMPAGLSATEVTSSMGKFFNAYNYAVSSSNTASSASVITPVTASARKTATDLRQTLSANTEVNAAMKKLGLKMGANGTLTQDAKVFADALIKDPGAVRSALTSLGTKVAATTDRELASSANLASTTTALNQRTTLLAAQQKAISAYTV